VPATITLAQARDSVLALVRAAWLTVAPAAPLVYDNVDSSAPAVPTTFGRATVRWVGSSRAALGPNGLWRREGLVFVQIFVPHGSTTVTVDSIAEALVRALENPGATGNIWFRDAGPSDIGSDGVYHQCNVVASFIFDTI